MRVLLVAEDCNPEWPSVPVFAYQTVKALAKYAEVVLVTQVRNWANIEKARLDGVKVVYLSTERVARPLWKLGMALRGNPRTGWLLADVLAYPSQIAFEYLAARRFRGPLRRKEFDVVQRLTPWIGLAPSYMASVCPVPYLLGPINGTLPWPVQSGDVIESDMTSADKLGTRMLPLLKRLPYQRSKYSKSDGILACYEHTIQGLPTASRAKAINFPEVGIDPTFFNTAPRTPQQRKTVIFVGRLVPLKRPDLLLNAFASSPILRQHRLLIVGDGPERAKLEALVAEHQLQDCVELLGWRTQEEVGQFMRQADIFAFPSIHEMGGAVVVEAMACGLVPVVVDYGGPATMVREEFGVKVAMGSTEQLVEGFRSELEQLVGDDEPVQRMGVAAHLHAMRYYSWDAKARKLMEIYGWLTDKSRPKPDFWDQPAAATGSNSEQESFV